MESNLDIIADGKMDYQKLLADFYKPFFKNLQQKEKDVKKSDFHEETKEMCEKCGRKMVIKFSKFGKFLACPGFPDCKNAKPIEGEEDGRSEEATTELCPKCNSPLLLKRGRFGKFYGCSAYPECKFMKSSGEQRTLGIKCRLCGEGEIIEKRSRRGRIFYGCSNFPKCKYANWNEPVDEECSICGELKVKKRGQDEAYCSNCDG
jgi:DNA topoisomerase-1